MAITVTILEDDECEEENAGSGGRIIKIIEEEGKKRGWNEKRLALLLGDSDEELEEATREIHPCD